MKRAKITIGQYLATRVYIYIYVLIIIIPLLYIISLSFRLPAEVGQTYFYFIPKHLTLSNYFRAIDLSETVMQVSIWRMFLNSLVITSISISLAVVISSTAAFGFSNYKFKGKELLFIVVLLTMMIPVQAYVIPLFFLIKKMNLLKNYFGVIFPYVTIGVPLSTLLFRGFFEEIPMEFKEAASLDGASDFYYFLKIVIPLSKPVLATVVIFLFLQFWNEFLLALVLIQKVDLQTIPLAMSRIATGKAPYPAPVHAAFILIAVIPIFILFMILQKWFIKGIAAGAIKG